MDTDMALLCGVCRQHEAVGVCNCILAQPISEAYCERCLQEGIEALWIIVGTVASCTIGYGHEPSEWRDVMASWAVDIIDRSLTFHDMTEDDLLKEASKIVRDGT